MNIIDKVFGTHSERELKRIERMRIRRINMEIVMQCLLYIVEILKVRH